MNAEEQFGSALIEYQSALFGFLYAQTGDVESARELLQESNLAILKSRQRLDSLANFKPWSKTVAAWTLKRWRTDRTREGKWLLFDDETAQSAARMLLEEPPRSDISVTALLRCLAKLPPDVHSLVRRRYWQGETIDRLSKSLGEKDSAVAMRLLRTRRALLDCVKGELCRMDGSSGAKDGDALKAMLFENAANIPAQCLGEWLEHAKLIAALHFNKHMCCPENTFRRRKHKRIAATLFASATLCAAAGIFFTANLATREETEMKTTLAAAAAATGAAALALVEPAQIRTADADIPWKDLAGETNRVEASSNVALLASFDSFATSSKPSNLSALDALAWTENSGELSTKFNSNPQTGTIVMLIGE